MQASEFTWGQVARIWWLIAWRTAVIALLVGFLVGFVIGFVGYFLAWDQTFTSSVVCLFTAPLGIIVSLWVVRMALLKNYRGLSPRCRSGLIGR
jgi:hypothetical protein